MVRKVLLILFLFCILGNSGLRASDNSGYQAAIIGAGVVLILLPALSAEPNVEPTDTEILLYTMGGGFIGIGVIWMLIDIADSGSSGGSSGGSGSSGGWEDVEDFSFRRKIRPILEHLSFGVLPNKVFIGANFRF